MDISDRFPSYHQVVDSAAATVRRFPLTLVCAALASVAAIILINLGKLSASPFISRLAFTVALGVPLFISLATFAERRFRSRSSGWLLQGIGVLLLIAYSLTLPDNLENSPQHFVRFAVLAAGLHFLVAFLPYLGTGQQVGFWQFNKALFLRFITAALYSGVLYLGLVIALLAADHLFGVDIDGKRYAQLLMLIGGLFNTWIFLAGIPSDLHALNESTSYPKGLKVFTQFILLPLVALYFAILIAYELKIVVAWNLPKGWVSQLVLWYSVVGILSLLLLHPLRTVAGSRWIAVLGRWYFRTIIPLVVMLFVAIFTRLGDYGFTENRYFVLTLAIGLAVVVLYFVFGRSKDIRTVPIVLCVIAFVAAYGPWGAFAVSERSQQARLETLMIDHGVLVDGTIRNVAGDLDFETRKEMSSIIDYLTGWHSHESFAAWLDDSTLASMEALNQYEQRTLVAEAFGFEYVAPHQLDGRVGSFYVHTDYRRTFDIAGFDYLIEFTNVSRPGGDSFAIGDGDNCSVMMIDSTGMLIVQLGADDSASLDMWPLLLGGDESSLLSLEENGLIPMSAATFDLSAETFDARIVFRDISGTRDGPDLQITSMSGTLLLARRHQ